MDLELCYLGSFKNVQTLCAFLFSILDIWLLKTDGTNHNYAFICQNINYNILFHLKHLLLNNSLGLYPASG